MLELLVYGMFDFSIWGYVVAALILTQITIASVTVYLHRTQAHRGLDLHPAVSHFFRFWLWLTTGMRTAEWVAVHRKHHARCETADDPHSPYIEGISKVLWQGAELYRAEAGKPETLARYSHGTPRDWIEQKLYSNRYGNFGLALMLIVDVVCFGLAGIAIFAVQMLWIPFWAAGVINGIGHWWGYRNFETPDGSTNITPVAMWIGGEELHNNHHAFPSSAKFSARWWEFDLGWLYIRILSALGLAKVKRVAPSPMFDPDKKRMDLDTVKAVIVSRMHVMRNYATSVVIPVLKEELRKADESYQAMLKRAKRLLIREESRMDENSRKRLNRVLSLNERLNTVYQFRRNLQEIWNLAGANQERLLHALQEWCTQAEASGIQALQEFAKRLQGFSLKAT